MLDLSPYRSAFITIDDKLLMLLPEFELTDYPPKVTLTQHEAQELLVASDADITIAGFVESDGTKLYSACIVKDGYNTYFIRKRKPYGDEKDMLSANEGGYSVLPLSIGNSVVILCADALDLGEDIEFLEMCREQYVENIFLVSAWKEMFSLGMETMNRLSDELGPKHCIIIDRFNGLVRIK